MKRLLFITAMFMAWIGAIKANEIVVPDIVIPKGGTAVLDIQLNNEQEMNRFFWFFINLPDGITVVDKSEKLSERFDGTNVSVAGTLESDGRYRIMCLNGHTEADDYPILGNSGTIVTVELAADESINEGTVLDGSIEDVEINLFFKGSEATPSDVPTTANFQITVGAPADTRIVLDETSTAIPTAATGVDVRVRRTIKANEWSTICLPFAMTEAQVKTAFGDDVQLGDFQGYEVKDNGESISVKFADVTAIEKNHPYIIKVGADVAEFTVDGVDVDPEEKPMINFGTNRYPNAFVGNYVAGTAIENGCLFLSDNKFWYSVGTTTIKGFRGYFNFDDLLPDFKDNYDAARVMMMFNDDDVVTGIDASLSSKGEHRYYNLGGQRISHPKKKGLYIQEGKKLIVK